MGDESIRVLYLSQYFPPEVGATQTRAYEIARGLVRSGHRVTMVTELPNHPRGEIWPDYRGKLWQRETVDGIDVLRLWVKASRRKTFIRRMAFYTTYAAAASVGGCVLARGPFDVVYATSPPLFVGAAAMALSVLRRVPLVFEVRDVWPEAAVALGELRSARAIRLAESLERRCYRRARRVVVVTEGTRRRLAQRGVPEEKLCLVPNGADPELSRPQPEAGGTLAAELGLEGAFVVLYGGIHGVAQGLSVVVDSARRLRDRAAIRFVFVGEGPVKAALVEQVRRLSLTNVLFHAEVPRERMAAFYSLAGVAVVPLRRLPIFEEALPSKLFDAWACACPTIVGIDGEAKALVGEAGAGVWVEPEDSSALARTIAELADEPSRCRAMGASGRRFVEARYSRAAQARQVEALLRQVVHRPVDPDARG